MGTEHQEQHGNHEVTQVESPGEAHRGHPQPHLVQVKVDNNEVQIEAGNYVVSVFKQIVGIAADRLLDRVVGPGKFVQLQETQTIHITGGELFVSYVKQGSSS